MVSVLSMMALTAPGYAAPNSASKNLLVLGDSLSAEYGLTRGSGWVALLQKRLTRESSDLAVINASISGETTAGGRSRIDDLLKQHKPGWVLIELGGNFFVHFTLVTGQFKLRLDLGLENGNGTLFHRLFQT